MKLKESSILFSVTAVGSILYAFKNTMKNRRNIEKQEKKTSVMSEESEGNNVIYDALVVGAGPAGSTASYFLGKNNLKVALLDKKKFPRQKICGDAWCKPALDILEEMGVLKKMEDDGITNSVRRGGLISPFGYECINTDGSSYGSVTGCKTYAIKRQIADEYLVRAASAESSVDLFENHEAINAKFIDHGTNSFWEVTINLTGEDKKNEKVLKTKMLLICDGAKSYLAKKLGILPMESKPESVSSHSYIKGKTHEWKDADGVMIFNRSMLPGYTALFRHYNNDMYLGTYILPGGKATSRSIADFEKEAIERHPYIRYAFGKKYQWEEKRVVEAIRMGGIPKSYGQQLLIVGDAAGHVDPLTGEGIHTAMVAGKIAGETIAEMFRKNNFTLSACRAYELRCYDAFGYEFFSSSVLARVLYYFPISIDAVAVVGKRRGQSFLDFFGEVMTGVRPKSDFMQPHLLFDITVEVCRQIVLQYIMGKRPLIPVDVGQAVVDRYAA